MLRLALVNLLFINFTLKGYYFFVFLFHFFKILFHFKFKINHLTCNLLFFILQALNL